MGAAWYERQGPNIELDEQLLPVDRMIATYASSQPMTAMPFWLLVFNEYLAPLPRGHGKV